MGNNTCGYEERTTKTIAENLDCGFRCYIHTKTRDIKFIPNYDQHPDMDSDVWDADSKEIEAHFDEYIQSDAMESSDYFQVMADFVETVTDENIRERLAQAHERPKPFRNFKFDIDNSGPYRNKWFTFKTERLINWVNRQLTENNLGNLLSCFLKS